MNSLHILVTNQICPKIERSENVIINTTETFIGTEVSFSCPAGYTSTGTGSSVCRDDGKNSLCFFIYLFNQPLVQPPGLPPAPPATPCNALP